MYEEKKPPPLNLYDCIRDVRIERNEWYQAYSNWNKKIRFTLTKSNLLYCVMDDNPKTRKAIQVTSFNFNSGTVVFTGTDLEYYGERDYTFKNVELL